MIVPTSIGTGVICVGSSPDGAELVINNNNLGNTPPNDYLYVTDLDPGYYDYTLKKAGFQDYHGKVLVEVGKPSFVSSNLLPQFSESRPTTQVASFNGLNSINSLQSTTSTSTAILFLLIGAGLLGLGFLLSQWSKGNNMGK